MHNFIKVKQFLKTISLLILLTFIFQLINAKAIFQISYQDTTTSDTIRFFRNLIKHQEKYYGQPFSVLLKDIPFKIEYYYPLISEKLAETYGIRISFIDSKKTNNENNDFNKIAILYVTWKNIVPSKDIYQMKMKNTYGWGDAEKNYFSTKIVDTIILTMPDLNVKNR